MATSKIDSTAGGESAGNEGTSNSGQTADNPRERRRARAESNRAAINVIRPAQAPHKALPDERARRPNAPAADAKRGANQVRAILDTDTVPDHVRARYVQDGRQYYLRSGERAFVDGGARLTTRSENTTIVRDLVTVAAARGWSEVVLAGTKTFRREAWREARLAGLAVKGYEPTRAEQALLIDALMRRSQETPGAERAPALQAGVAGRPASAREDSPLVTGKLLAHGPARDPNDPEQGLSYRVVLKTPRGEREVWGADLERAIRQSLTDVQVGDDIGLRAVARLATLPKSRSAEAAGVVSEAAGDERRDGWIVEQRRFFSDRTQLAKVFRDAALRPSEGYRKHPELKGSYLELQAAKLRFEQSVKNPEDQTAFLAQLRERMAAAMERGEPLTPVRLRERPKAADIPDPPQQLVR